MSLYPISSKKPKFNSPNLKILIIFFKKTPNALKLIQSYYPQTQTIRPPSPFIIKFHLIPFCYDFTFFSSYIPKFHFRYNNSFLLQLIWLYMKDLFSYSSSKRDILCCYHPIYYIYVLLLHFFSNFINYFSFFLLRYFHFLFQLYRKSAF